MLPTPYLQRRSQIENYFDRTAHAAWTQLTSNSPVGRIRATVRAGRDEMRRTLMSWLPSDLGGLRLLDAGCGTGALSVEAARRGAQVVAVDLSPTLIDVARQRAPHVLGRGAIHWHVGDLLDPTLGTFDHIVAMDSLIHYPAAEVVRILSELAARASTSVLFTFAPRTPLLAAMHTIGRAFPRSERAPAIEPVPPIALARSLIDGIPRSRTARTHRVTRGFYISQAMELTLT
jgi:magnesium-protoporphyrin O-methyltransferase